MDFLTVILRDNHTNYRFITAQLSFLSGCSCHTTSIYDTEMTSKQYGIAHYYCGLWTIGFEIIMKQILR